MSAQREGATAPERRTDRTLKQISDDALGISKHTIYSRVSKQHSYLPPREYYWCEDRASYHYTGETHCFICNALLRDARST